MLGAIFLAFLLYFGSPIILLFLIFKLFADLAEYYGAWIFPAVFGLTMGITLKLTGVGDPDLPYSTLPETIAGSHIAGIETPNVLLIVGVISLLGVPLYRVFRRTKSA